MRPGHYLFVLSFILNMQGIAQQSWTKQSPPIYKSNFSDVFMLNDHSAVLIGSNSCIFKTTDMGNHWNAVNSNLSNQYISLYSAQFLNSSTGWIAGSSNTLLKTIDGGDTWNAITITSPANPNLSEIHFFDSNTGWSLGGRTVYKTTDGGIQWTAKFTAPSMTYLTSIHFFNVNTGLAVGSSGTGKIYRTGDGGLTWNEINLGGATWIYDVSFSDQFNGLAGGLRASRITITTGGMFGDTSIDIENPYYSVWKTTDGGVSWSQINLSFSGRVYKVHCINQNEGWAAGEGGLILKTTDGGAAWAMTKTIHDMNSIHFYNSQTGIAVGEMGTILNSSNGGNSWNLISGSGTSNNLSSVLFLNNNVGLAVGSNGTILNTLDGGDHWNDYYISYNSSSTTWNSVCFPDSLSGYLLGQGFNNILTTTNAGASWTWNERQSSSNINDAFFMNRSLGWFVGDQGIIGCRNGNSYWNMWNKQTSNTTKKLYSVFFINELTGWVAGEDSTLLHTENAGNTWISCKDRLPSGIPWGWDIKSIYFTDLQNGWIAGSSGIILKTVDGGVHWAESFNLGTDLKDIYFANKQKGWAVGEKGRILRTEDGGDHWGLLDGQTDETLRSVFFINENHGWVVGSNGIILKTENSGGNAVFGPPMPNPSMPADGAQNISINPAFHWDNSNGATEYELQISTNPDFSFIVYTGYHVQATELDFGNDLDFQKTYYWRVRASNGVLYSRWSQGRSFTTEKAAWTLQGEEYNLRNVFFINKTKGWIVGDEGAILTTENGGNTWEKKIIDSGLSLTKVQFINESIGWISGYKVESSFRTGGAVYSTTDGGKTWNRISTDEMLQGSHACINDICLIGSSVGYISTNYYTYKTTNGGLGWNRIDCPANKLFFINDKIGWASQYSSILKTTDGGLRWIYQDIGITDRVDDIFFTDANNGWGTGYPDTYIYTNDGGSHWYQKYLNNDHDISRIYSLYFIDSNTGWIAGSTNNYDTIILKTNDGGKSWADCTVPGSSAYIACIYFLDAENGWAVGSGIWHTSSGGTSTTLRDISLNEDVYPEAFYLKQNYPNPFNDETLIEYGIPEKCNVNVKVFDIHGSQIIKIKDAMENAGNYTIKWDGKNGSNQSIPSGIYLCRIQAGKYQKTLRMLLLK